LLQKYEPSVPQTFRSKRVPPKLPWTEYSASTLTICDSQIALRDTELRLGP